LLKKYADKFNLVSIPNARSLHQKRVPQGGGVVIGLVFLSFCIFSYFSGNLRLPYFLAIFYGGLVICITGFLDDIFDIKPFIRLIIQVIVSLWGLYWIGGIKTNTLLDTVPLLFLIFNLFSIILVVWSINAFNFMDGIDGMAASGAIFFSLSIGTYLFFGLNEALGTLLIILAASSLAFLYFNWSPAKIFLGDSGSYFFGYVFVIISMITVKDSHLSVITWLIILGYFITDTAFTTIYRFLFVEDWSGTHRSHAYQNIARKLNNHKIVTVLVIAINIFYLLPLAYISNQYLDYKWYALVLGITPILLFVLKYGPRYEE
tara:strand:+ start:29156 stop:30109 length:954 start_codon:yes stop_codon:yes gene_type:complete